MNLIKRELTREEICEYVPDCPKEGEISKFAISDAYGRREAVTVIGAIDDTPQDISAIHYKGAKHPYDVNIVSGGTYVTIEMKDRNCSRTSWAEEGFGVEAEKIDKLLALDSSYKGRTVEKWIMMTFTDGAAIWDAADYTYRGESPEHKKKTVEESDTVTTKWCYYHLPRAKWVVAYDLSGSIPLLTIQRQQ